MWQFVYQLCYTRYQVPFYLWWIGHVLKHCKVPKYYAENVKTIKVWRKLGRVMLRNLITAWKVSKYGVFSGPYFPVLDLNTEIYSKYMKNTDQKKLVIWTLFTQWFAQTTMGKIFGKKSRDPVNWTKFPKFHFWKRD